MKFSVILANYNGASYLETAIQSVLDQSYDNVEFIIVDDGSTDRSVEIINRFVSRHPEKIKPLFHCGNKGQAAGFNSGIAVAAGDYVAFIDSDDCWMPEKLSNVARCIALSPAASLYQHNLFLMREDTPTMEPFRAILTSGRVYEHCMQTRCLPSFAPTSGLVFPLSILKRVFPIPGQFRTCADGYLTRTAFCHGPVMSCSESWGYYRIHATNNVFANSRHSNRRYRYHLLVPALNQYYVRIGSPLCFPTYKRMLPEAGENDACMQTDASALSVCLPSWTVLAHAWFLALTSQTIGAFLPLPRKCGCRQETASV